MKKNILFCSLLVAFLLGFGQIFAQSTSWKGTFNTYWNNPLNWTNGIPDNTKDAILGDANFTGINQPKVNVVSTCKTVTIGGAVATTLTFSRTLTVLGNLLINPNGIAIQANTTTNLAGDFINNGAYVNTATSSRIIFNGTNQTVGGTSVTTFRRVTINASSTVTLATNIKLDSTGSLLAVYGSLDPGQSPSYSVTATGLARVYDGGKIKVNASAFTSNYIFTGATTLYSGSTVEYGSNTTNQVISPVYSYSTLLLSGSGTKSLTANLLPLYGRNIAQGKIIINAGITFDMGIYTANRATNTVGGEFNLASGALLKVGGTGNYPANFSLRVLAPTSTVEYNGIDQTVSAQNYGNLLFSTAGIKTATTAFNVMGNLLLNNGTLNTNATVVNHSIAGDFIMTGGAFTGTNYTYTLNGTSNQSVSLVTPINKLSVNKLSGKVDLASNITVSNTLNFISGIIETGVFEVIMPVAANITGAAQSTGWVKGNLTRNIPTGTSIIRSFEIGEATYAPVSIVFASVAIAGDLTATTTSTDQPEIDYSGIDPDKSVNRFWSLNNSGILFTTASATFGWTATDIDPGSTTANFKTGMFNGSNWILPAVVSPLPNSIQANGITNLGDFSVGENIGRSTWTGNAMTSDWFTPKNWRGLVPTNLVPTIIPGGISPGRVYPVLSSATGIVNDITIENTASLTVSNGVLQIAGVISNAGNFTASSGTIEFNGNTTQHIPAGAFSGNLIKNLIVSNDVILDDATIITGTLTVDNTRTLTTNDQLVLKSDATGTARIASLPVDGSGNATAFITGNVSIERYIPARKAWRLLSAPISTGGATSITAAWQEGVYSTSFAPDPNPHPGYGVHIMGGTVANGFDQSPTNSPSMKIYSQTTNSFVALPSTPGTFAKLNSYTGYLVYIRGDRGIDLSQGNNAAVTATTLRMKGGVNTGNQAYPVNAANFTVMGNPYPSAIDFATLTRNNVKNSFYVWDPKLAGSNGLGGYVTVSYNSGTGLYDVTSSASPVSQYIPSGEAILIESMDGINPGSIIIKESDKTANGSDMLFGRPATSGKKLRTNLLSKNSDGTSSLLDGALTTYENGNTNELDANDITKIAVASENIALLRGNHNLAIERRTIIVENDTTFLQLKALRKQQYILQVIAEQLEVPGFIAVLKDKYLATVNNTTLNMNGTTEVVFDITDDPASFDAGRFSIVFIKQAATTFTISSVKATPQQKNIAVEWQIQNESAVTNYEVQTSDDGIKFVTSSMVNAKSNNGSNVSYSWFDLNASDGTHYYRIKSNTANGSKLYSNIAKADMKSLVVSGNLAVFPNPVVNNTVSIQVASLEKAVYLLQVFNINGQLVKKQSIQHNGGDMKYVFQLDETLPAGKYQVQLSGTSTLKLSTSLIKE